jgi:hypothetical protein
MLTVGVDLAAEPANTAVVRMRWAGTGSEVEALALGADDLLLVQEIAAADKAGVDCRSAGRGGSSHSSPSIRPARSPPRSTSRGRTGDAGWPSGRPTW